MITAGYGPDIALTMDILLPRPRGHAKEYILWVLEQKYYKGNICVSHLVYHLLLSDKYKPHSRNNTRMHIHGASDASDECA